MGFQTHDGVPRVIGWPIPKRDLLLMRKTLWQRLVPGNLRQMRLDIRNKTIKGIHEIGEQNLAAAKLCTGTKIKLDGWVVIAMFLWL